MAPPPCKPAFMANYASNMTANGLTSCYLRKGLMNGSIDSLRIASEDCDVPICLASLHEIEAKANNCTFIEAQSGQLWQLAHLQAFCDLQRRSSQAADTKPSWFNTNKAIIIWVSAAIIVLLLAVVLMLWRRNRQQRALAASALVRPAPYAPLHDSRSLHRHHGTTFATHSQHLAQPNASTMAGGPPISASTFSNGPLPSMIGIPESLLDMCGLEVHRLASHDVRPVQAIAQGASGEVWIGQYLGGMVALKKLLVTKANSIPDLQKFIWEIQLHSKIDSPYVVQFIGVTWTKPANITLVTEFMDGGDLRGVLQANASRRSFTWRHKVRCALHVAEGLVYLHTMEPAVIHRDLKSRNVLLDSEFNAKITDFGIARETDDTTMTAGIGTYRWIAPEVLMDGHYSELADLFSFGVIMSELDTEVLPYSDLRNASGNPFTDTTVMAKVMTDQMQPSFSATCPEWFSTLAKECLALAPAVRPTAMQVAYRLRLHLDELTM